MPSCKKPLSAAHLAAISGEALEDDGAVLLKALVSAGGAPVEKRRVTLRLDADVIERFLKNGRIDHARVNAALRACMAAQARGGK